MRWWVAASGGGVDLLNRGAMLVRSRPCSRSGGVEKGFAVNAVVFEHVPVAELPEKWRAKLASAGGATVTVRIEEEVPSQASNEMADDPLFGMWRDREDMADVAGYVRKLRASRFNEDDFPRKD